MSARVSQIDELRVKNRILIAELMQSNERLQRNFRRRAEDRRSVDPEEEEELKKSMKLQWKEEELQQREEELQWREEELQQREEELQWREEELQQREEELQWREEELQQQGEKLLRKEEELQLKEEELQWQEEELRHRKAKKWSCQRCEHQAQEHRHTMSEIEAFYKDKLTEARSALKEKEEQLRSFKDRVAQNVVLSLKTENTENMNSPVNQSRLTEMYQQLRVCTWPNIHFSSSDSQARVLVQEAFDEAAKHMEVFRTSMKKLFDFRTSPKVEKFRHTVLENLQLALFHSSREDVFKAAFPQYQAAPEDLLLASECYWLGCLMGLNSPPLRPDWDSADAECVFPTDVLRQTCSMSLTQCH